MDEEAVVKLVLLGGIMIYTYLLALNEAWL